MCIWSLGFCITATCCMRGKLGTCFDSLYVHTYGRADGDVREVKPNRCWGDGREAEQALSWVGRRRGYWLKGIGDQTIESADWGQTGQSCFEVPAQDQTLVVHTTQDQTSRALDLGRSHTSVHLLSASICATLTLTLFEEGGGGDCYVIVFDFSKPVLRFTLLMLVYPTGYKICFFSER